MVDGQERDTADDSAQFDLDQPVLGRDEGAEVVKKTQGDPTVIRFEEGSDEILDTGQSKLDGDGRRLVDEEVLADVDDVGEVRTPMLEPSGQVVAVFDLNKWRKCKVKTCNNSEAFKTLAL
jgi:hypothetical protein